MFSVLTIIEYIILSLYKYLYTTDAIYFCIPGFLPHTFAANRDLECTSVASDWLFLIDESNSAINNLSEYIRESRIISRGYVMRNLWLLTIL